MKFYIVLFWLFSGFGFCQSNIIYVSILRELNFYNTREARLLAQTLEASEKRFFIAEIDYIEKGTLDTEAIFGMANSNNEFLKGLYYNALGDLELRTSKKFSQKAHLNYLKSLEIANILGSPVLKSESLRRILMNYQINNMNSGDYEKYSLEYLQTSQDSIDIFWAKYYHYFLKAYKKFNKEKVEFSSENYDSLIPLVQNNPILLGKIYQMKDVCSVIDSKIIPNRDLQISKSYYKKSNYFLAKKALLGLLLNEAVNDLDKNDLKSGIKKLRACFSANIINKDEELKILIITSLYDAYSKTNKLDSAVYFLNMKNETELKIKKNENYLITHEIDTKYNLKQKNKQIELQQRLVESYQKNRVLYTIAVIFASIAILYLIYLWKKEKIKKQKLHIEKMSLEVEHFKTSEELKNVKKLIEKESVILRDKTKVNLEQLAYIKADDHYLSIHTIEKKNHFVRGKLSDIIDELPSNFVKCHRSYIINKNHIKQIQSKLIIMNDNSEIPISRGFKI